MGEDGGWWGWDGEERWNGKLLKEGKLETHGPKSGTKGRGEEISCARTAHDSTMVGQKRFYGGAV